MKWAFITLLYMMLTVGVWYGGYCLDNSSPYRYSGYVSKTNEASFDKIVLNSLKDLKTCEIESWDYIPECESYQFIVIADDFPMGNKLNRRIDNEIALTILFTILYWAIVVGIEKEKK